MDLNDLPRVDLNELILGGYAPVAVSNEPGQEFIVIAPESSDLPFSTNAPVARMTPTEHSRMMMERAAQATLADKPLRSRIVGLARQGRPPNEPDIPSGLSFDPPENIRSGFSQETGQPIQQPRVTMSRGQGVGSVSAVPGMGSEMGSSSPSPFTSWMRREYNRDLIGVKGLRVYDRMRKSDGTVRGTLRLAKTPVLAGLWSIKPATSSSQDQMIANFVWQNMTEWMSTSWPQTLTESLLMLDFGYYMFELVFTAGEILTADPAARGKIVWRKWAPRHPMDVRQWFFDLNGGPMSVDMWTTPARVPTWEGATVQTMMQYTNIPIDKMMVFSFDKEAGNIEGISLLRSAHKHWYYKDNLYKIDAIQKERHGIGVPVIQLPPGYGAPDLQMADSLGRNLRTNDRAHVVLPPNWVLTFAELKGNPVNCIQSIEHHDQQIQIQILGNFLSQNVKTDEADHTLFLKATRFTADIVTDVINSYGIPQLVDMNWAGARYPKLTVKRIGEVEDWRTASFTIRNYVGAGVIVPDQPLEDHLRDEMGLPPADPKTSRLVYESFNKNVTQPPPAEMPGEPGDIQEALQTGQMTPQQVQQAQNIQQANGQQAGMPRQANPPTPTPPTTGKGDNSGRGGRRGQ